MIIFYFILATNFKICTFCSQKKQNVKNKIRFPFLFLPKYHFLLQRIQNFSIFFFLFLIHSHRQTRSHSLTHTHKTPFLQPPPDCFPWKIKFSFTDDLYRRLLTLLNIIPKENMSRILGREVAFPCSYRSTYLYLDAHFIPISSNLLLTL